MREILRQSNTHVLRELERLGEVLQSVAGSVLSELDTYYAWIVAAYDGLRQQVLQHLHDLDLGQDAILPDVLSSTQEVTRFFYLFNQRLVSPILRVRPSDRLCLKLLRWLHAVHPQTQDMPAALSDGEFASWPSPRLPTIYFMPPSAQQGLLYLPLFFHEFGHLLYTCHEPELDDLVRSLQEKIAELLEPSVQRDDPHHQLEVERRKTIVEAWYEWAQELFCDAVGLAIGGPSFAHAFSMHLRMLGRGHYYLPPEELAGRDHPVTWLRIQLLAHRARGLGYAADADALKNTWKTIANAMAVNEDYHGFYDPEFLPVVQQTIDDMLTETSPVTFTEQEDSSSETAVSVSSPVQLLNQAWRKFWEDPEGFRAWEESAIAAFLRL